MVIIMSNFGILTYCDNATDFLQFELDYHDIDLP